MKKAQIVLLALAVLVLCVACAGAAAAPEPTPTPTETPTAVPLPTPVGTPDPLWADICVELGENLDVCLLAQDKIKTTLLTGPVVVAKLIFADENLNFRTLEVGVEKDEIGYETFVVDAKWDLSGFGRVFIYIGMESREWEFGFPVEYCGPTS